MRSVTTWSKWHARRSRADRTNPRRRKPNDFTTLAPSTASEPGAFTEGDEMEIVWGDRARKYLQEWAIEITGTTGPSCKAALAEIDRLGFEINGLYVANQVFVNTHTAEKTHRKELEAQLAHLKAEIDRLEKWANELQESEATAWNEVSLAQNQRDSAYAQLAAREPKRVTHMTEAQDVLNSHEYQGFTNWRVRAMRDGQIWMCINTGEKPDLSEETALLVANALLRDNPPPVEGAKPPEERVAQINKRIDEIANRLVITESRSKDNFSLIAAIQVKLSCLLNGVQDALGDETDDEDEG